MDWALTFRAQLLGAIVNLLTFRNPRNHRRRLDAIRRLNVNAEVELSGLSSPEKLASLRSELLKGRVTFKELMDRV